MHADSKERPKALPHRDERGVRETGAECSPRLFTLEKLVSVCAFDTARGQEPLAKPSMCTSRALRALPINRAPSSAR